MVLTIEGAGAERGAYERLSALADPVAAIDLGTNNCRLLVACGSPAGLPFRVIDSFSRIIRLGEGVETTGRLDAGAMDRAVDALAICASKMRRRGVRRMRAVATEACRRARNYASFGQRVYEETGVVLEVISPREEARLALAGCAPLLEAGPDRALVFDIGGGSSELMWLAIEGGRVRLIDSLSLPVGVASLAEEYGGGRIAPSDYDEIAQAVAEMIEPFDHAFGIGRRFAQGRVQMLGSSGTVTTLAAVSRGLRRYDRSQIDGTWLDAAAADAVSRRLLSQDLSERAADPCIGVERADLVVAGCAILSGILTLWPARRMRVADRGVREGILADLLAGDSRTGASIEA